MIRARVFHQMIGRGPVAMAIEQRPNDSAIQDAGKRFVLRLRRPLRDDVAVFRKTANPQTFAIRRSTAPARIFRSVLLLQRLLHHDVDLTPWQGPDIFAAAVRCKASAAESIDYDRVARPRARTNQPRATPRRAACLTLG